MKALLIFLAIIGLMNLASWIADITPAWVSVILFILLMFFSLRALFRFVVGIK